MHSFIDKKGKTWVSCSECERGGNGNDKDKCAAGYNVKRFNHLGCYSGTLLSSLNLDREDKK